MELKTMSEAVFAFLAQFSFPSHVTPHWWGRDNCKAEADWIHIIT